jgi:hypothetical protein
MPRFLETGSGAFFCPFLPPRKCDGAGGRGMASICLEAAPRCTRSRPLLGPGAGRENIVGAFIEYALPNADDPLTRRWRLGTNEGDSHLRLWRRSISAQGVFAESAVVTFVRIRWCSVHAAWRSELHGCEGTVPLKPPIFKTKARPWEAGLFRSREMFLRTQS